MSRFAQNVRCNPDLVKQIGARPGRWFLLFWDGPMAKLVQARYCRRDRAGWRATVWGYMVATWPTKEPALWHVMHVLGNWPTPEAAVEGARDALALVGVPRQATPRDIDRVRKELREAAKKKERDALVES